jgi:transcriptional regulator with XRE-family HTH domain
MEAHELKEQRESKGLSQRELAKLCGVPQRDISRIEGGRQRARDKVVKKLSEALK